MNTAAARDRLKKFEGCVPYLYRCAGGEVTVGVGHAVLTADDCCRLEWAAQVTEAAVRSAFAKVAAAPLGQVAPAYEALTAIRLEAAAIDRLLESDVALFAEALERALPQWKSYPEPAQEALFDMAYNLGIGGLLKFHKLLSAAQAARWEEAASECHRAGISSARNQETAALFRACAAQA